MQRLAQPRDRSVTHHPLVHDVVGEARLTAAKQPQHEIGKPAGVTHRAAAERRRSRQFIAAGVTGRDGLLDLGRKLRAHALVGIDRQHPVAGRKRKREALLRAESLPCMADDTRALGLGDLAPYRRCCRNRQRSARRRTTALARQSAMFVASFLVMMMALSRGTDVSNDEAPALPRHASSKPCFAGPRQFGAQPRRPGQRRRLRERERSTIRVVLKPGTRSTSTTSPPCASTMSRPTTWSRR